MSSSQTCETAPVLSRLDSLLDVLLCERNSDTGFAGRRCSYGDCESYGWDVKMGELDPSDTVEEKDNDDMKEREMFVPFQTYESLQDEHVSVECDEDGDFAAVSKPMSRPCCRNTG